MICLLPRNTQQWRHSGACNHAYAELDRPQGVSPIGSQYDFVGTAKKKAKQTQHVAMQPTAERKSLAEKAFPFSRLQYDLYIQIDRQSPLPFRSLSSAFQTAPLCRRAAIHKTFDHRKKYTKLCNKCVSVREVKRAKNDNNNKSKRK